MKIEPLSKKTLKEAIELLVKIFHSKPTDFDAPQKWLPASLNPDLKNSKNLYKSYNTTYLEYYVGTDEKSKNVMGMTGIYTKSDDENDSAWLAYYCVDSKFRGKGYGSKLLDFVLDRARKMGKKYIKLYTSYNLDIKRAMQVYERRGFKIDKVENHPNTDQEMVFMSAKLK